MKHALILSLLFLGFSVSIQASEDKAYVSHCSNFTSGNQAVSYSFSSCVNNNFNSLGRDFESPVYTSYCSNFGNSVSYSFISCINNNFSTLARALDRSIYISHCGNYSSDELSYSFVSCANNNFRRINQELNNR